MLEQVLDFIHNYFAIKKVSGDFSIKSGALDVDFLKDGQYFYITGSIFNDGLHLNPDKGLSDEDFTGQVWGLAIPPAVIALSEEIDTWVEKNGENTPYTSESFKGYSYTRGTGKNGEPIGWKDVFGGRLNRWRKIS